jgi:hypothetical protein
MKSLISFEEISKLILTFLLSLYLGYAWWVFLVWLLVPDLSMLGYLVNPRVGAWLYNLFHHQALAIGVGLAGLGLASPELQLAGLVLFGHSAMDRAFGYGLKHEDSFQHTHLGRIGKA